MSFQQQKLNTNLDHAYRCQNVASNLAMTLQRFQKLTDHCGEFSERCLFILILAFMSKM